MVRSDGKSTKFEARDPKETIKHEIRISKFERNAKQELRIKECSAKVLQNTMHFFRRRYRRRYRRRRQGMKKISEKKIQQLVKTVLDFYHTHGRHELPWRHTRDPYAILVSEMMLQQTQVARVIPAYHLFLERFPSVHVLAQASLEAVLTMWQGLGYNRRTKFLRDMARFVIKRHHGIIPTTFEGLQTLPGVGAYTAGAVCAFAYDIPVPIVETNIRTLVIHECCAHMQEVSDAYVLAVVESTLRHIKSPREWYFACMDYGSHLKAQGVRVHRKSTQYVQQSAFVGSARQVRGAIVRVLTNKKCPMSIQEITCVLGIDVCIQTVEKQCTHLSKEGMLQSEKGGLWRIA